MQNEPVDLNKNYQTLLILWAAMLMSQILFLVVIFVVKPELFRFEFTQPVLGPTPALTIALIALSMNSFFLSFFFRKKFLRESVEKQQPQLVQTALILGCAFGESISLFGLVMAFAAEYQYFFIFFALGILTILLSFPKRDDVMAAGFKR